MSDRIKKLLMSIGALAALAAGGAAFASAQGSPSTPTPTPPAESGTAPEADTGTEANEGAEKAHEKDSSEAEDNVTGDAASRAKDAALAAVPGGKVGEISAETPDTGDDTPEPGDKADPAYESKIAYDVEVTKPDGSQISVQLDKAFNVLGTEQDDNNEHDGEQADG